MPARLAPRSDFSVHSLHGAVLSQPELLNHIFTRDREHRAFASGDAREHKRSSAPSGPIRSAAACGALLDVQLTEETAKIRKFQIVYGRWWPHYVAPYELRWTLFSERGSCPYCSGVLVQPQQAVLLELGTTALLAPHIDHMDPLARGGEESVRNAVYACASCNPKGSRLFVEWLRMLPNQASAGRSIPSNMPTSRKRLSQASSGIA